METAEPTRTQLTSLMSNDLLQRVTRMRLVSQRKLTSRSRGEHLTGRGGTSTEFADYRDYSMGDDLRYIDWNIFSRLRRPYVKLYHMEEEQHVVVLVDASASMDFEGKLDRAKEMAAALGAMGLMGQERVSVYAFNQPDALPTCLPPTTGRTSLRKLLRFIETIGPADDSARGQSAAAKTGAGASPATPPGLIGAAPVEEGIEAMLRKHRGRGMVILLSDFLTFGDIRKAFNLLNSAGLEVMAVQVLSPTEIDPDVTGDLRLVDSELDATLDVTAGGNILSIYQAYRRAFQDKLEGLSRSRGGRYLCVNTADPLSEIVLERLRRFGWVR